MYGSLAFLALLFTACGQDEAPEVEVPSWAKVAPEQIAEAAKHGVPVAFENDLGMRFVLIPAGTFLMGSPEDEEGRVGYSDETQHEVTVPMPFYMSIYEVTNGQYRQAVPGYVAGELEGHSVNGDDLPVGARFRQAQTLAIHATGLVDQRTYRLPTEAEWEYACRAGTTTRFSFGDSVSTAQANYGWISISGDSDGPGPQLRTPIRAVGSYAPNAWGLYDMHGNRQEWTSDYYAPYSAGDASTPPGSMQGTSRVLRGGSWRTEEMWVRSAARAWSGPQFQRYDQGFRLVSPLPEPGEPAH